MHNKRISANILANMIGRIWAFISIFIFVPIYVKLLGIEAYGVITFYSVILSFLAFADAGFSATLNREFAKIESYKGYKISLFVTIERIYILVSFLVVLFVNLFAPIIVENFLSSQSFPYEKLVLYTRYMGVIIGLFFFGSLYQGALMGLQKQIRSNILGICYNAAKAGIVIIPLFFFRSLDLYFIWQIGVTALYVIISRVYTIRSIGDKSMGVFNISLISPIWRYTVSMMALSLIYAANTQIDKLAVAKLLPLADLGLYFMASSVGQASLILISPIGLAIFPEFTRLISINDSDTLRYTFAKYSYIGAMIISAVICVIFCYTLDYVAIWQQNLSIAEYITPSIRILLIGYYFMGIQLLPYYLALANGYTRINLILGASSVIVLLPLMNFFIAKFGFVGASLPWLIINTSATLILAFVVINKFIKNDFRNWLFINTILPSFVSIVVSSILFHVFCLLGQDYWTIIYGIIIFISSILTNLCIFYRLYPKEFKLKIYNAFIHNNTNKK